METVSAVYRKVNMCVVYDYVSIRDTSMCIICIVYTLYITFQGFTTFDLKV